MELVYAQIFLADGGVRVWTSRTGERVEVGNTDWRDLMAHPALRPAPGPAKVMIHFFGAEEGVSDEARLKLMAEARTAGFGLVRFEAGDPPLDPEEAFGLLLTPFT